MNLSYSLHSAKFSPDRSPYPTAFWPTKLIKTCYLNDSTYRRHHNFEACVSPNCTTPYLLPSDDIFWRGGPHYFSPIGVALEMLCCSIKYPLAGWRHPLASLTHALGWHFPKCEKDTREEKLIGGFSVWLYDVSTVLDKGFATF